MFEIIQIIINFILTTTGPPFIRTDCGTVEDKLLRLGIVSGRGLQSPNKRSMTQFRLGVSANDAKIPSPAHPLGLLVNGSLAHDGRQEHDKVHSHWVAVLGYSGSKHTAQ